MILWVPDEKASLLRSLDPAAGLYQYQSVFAGKRPALGRFCTHTSFPAERGRSGRPNGPEKSGARANTAGLPGNTHLSVGIPRLSGKSNRRNGGRREVPVSRNEGIHRTV